jgi:hypothetical protein
MFGLFKKKEIVNKLVALKSYKGAVRLKNGESYDFIAMDKIVPNSKYPTQYIVKAKRDLDGVFYGTSATFTLDPSTTIVLPNAEIRSVQYTYVRAITGYMKVYE